MAITLPHAPSRAAATDAHGVPWTILRCPEHPDAGTLLLRNPSGSSAAGECPRCRWTYSTVRGVLDLLAPRGHLDPFQQQEMHQWDAQAAHYEAARQRDRIYEAGDQAAAWALQAQPGELVLDAGCGTGMTARRYWRPGLRLACLDLSHQSLQVLAAAVPAGAVCLVRGDLTALPFADGVFDRVLCANALQHLPDEDLRRASVAELVRVVRPGGRVVVTVHNYSRPKRRAGWRKEGATRGASGNVQYTYRYEAEEFRSLLAAHLQVESVRGAGLPLPYRLKLSWLSRRLERLLTRFAASADWGHMLVGVGRRPPVRAGHSSECAAP